MTKEKSYTGWYFLALTVLLYLVLYFFSPEKIISALEFSKTIIFKILPILVIVFVLMALTNYYVKPKKLVKYLGKNSGVKGWCVSIIAGIISSGPIYMWYPLLNELQKKGMRPALISAFLYNRSVKIPLLPLLIMYFGIVYSILLTVVIIVASVFQGMATEKLVGWNK
ncbi:hypothetical protein JW868_00705 [Candidatus Woesearchaeota archaeon]|nr:hypothetical protein [Candidatus Woesearchaeota archaeon]